MDIKAYLKGEYIGSFQFSVVGTLASKNYTSCTLRRLDHGRLVVQVEWDNGVVLVHSFRVAPHIKASQLKTGTAIDIVWSFEEEKASGY